RKDNGDGQPAGAYTRGSGSIAAAAGNGSDRPVVSAPCRSEGANRGGRGHRREAGERGQGALLRSFGGWRADDPARSWDASCDRAAERVFVMGTESGAEDHPAAAGIGDR